MRNDRAIPETPILRSSLMASTPERVEMMRDLSTAIRQSLRECHRQNLERDPVAPGLSGTRRKLRRRVPDMYN
jgi:hypothetical protein